MQINEEEVRRGVILRRPKGKAPRPPRPKSEVFLDQAAKRRSKRYSAFGVSQSNALTLRLVRRQSWEHATLTASNSIAEGGCQT